MQFFILIFLCVLGYIVQHESLVKRNTLVDTAQLDIQIIYQLGLPIHIQVVFTWHEIYFYFFFFLYKENKNVIWSWEIRPQKKKKKNKTFFMGRQTFQVGSVGQNIFLLVFGKNDSLKMQKSDGFFFLFFFLRRILEIHSQ